MSEPRRVTCEDVRGVDPTTPACCSECHDGLGDLVDGWVDALLPETSVSVVAGAWSVSLCCAVYEHVANGGVEHG